MTRTSKWLIRVLVGSVVSITLVGCGHVGVSVHGSPGGVTDLTTTTTTTR